jgi:NADH:ubiquinone oxidoreductase subunit F (NADH-binding)
MGAPLGHAERTAGAFASGRQVEREPAMSSSSPTLAAHRPTRAQAPAATLPRLLSGIQPRGALTLEQHLAVHGPMPDGASARGRRGARERASSLINEIEHAGLLGHGGAAFPAAAKIRAVAVAGTRRHAIVIANGAEGEPASLKDRTLLESLPHLVLDGAILAAQAVRTEEVIVCVCESAGAGLERVAHAIEERIAAGSQRARGLRLVSVPSHYVAGQESALVSFLNRGAAKPTFTPPRPFERGVGNRPTLVNNVETLAHVALIARHGASWFRELGIPSQPGSALVTMSGAIARPGVYEIEHGASLSSLVAAAGGATARVHAALLGGYAGSWVSGRLLKGVALSNEHLAPHGASLGTGVVLLLSENACPVAESARLARWLAGQSARQCGPCVHGLDALASTLEELARGIAGTRVGARIGQLTALVSRRGACGHPDGALGTILSALDAFEAEFAEHARHGPCAACSRAPELPLPDRQLSDVRIREHAGRR